MKFWKNTLTLDKYLPEILKTVDPAEAEIAVIGGKKIDLNSMPKLKAIFKCGVGTDNVPFEEAAARSIDVWMPSDETKRYIFEETANFAVYLIFRMLFNEAGEIEGWKKQSREFLGNKKVLVLGQGNIGSHVARKLKALVEVLTYDAIDNSIDELPGLMKQADVISLHIPLMNSTKAFIDAEKLGWMKDGAAIVNTARGPVVEEDALFKEIQAVRLRAAFDVFWEEPYEGKLKNFHPHGFLMSPHVSSNCEDFLTGLAQDLRNYLIRMVKS